ncbi:MAG: SPFH domain-containing protein [Bacteroidota bacterium]|nr:SPFH domain-containing protein [Bacteroidota bacterium]
MEFTIVLVVIVILLLLGFFAFLVKRYKRCPSDRILVVYGKIGGKQGTAKCVHGGAAFIIPVIQDYEYLDLTPIPIEVGLENALSRQNIRVNVPSRFMVGISTEAAVMANAAERLLGLTQAEIRHLAADIIFGQLRVVIATMDIEEINADREKFLTNVSSGVEHELRKIGLKLINVNVTDITDNDGYIEALGKEATAHAVNDAKKLVAEKNRDGEIGQANAVREQRIQVSEANSQAEIGEADATQRQRVAVSAANAKAVDGENKAKVNIANSNAHRREQEAVATKLAVTAEKTNEAKALEDSYEAERLAEIKRAEREEATQKANIIIPAQIQKEKITIDADAEAERTRREAKGDADALLLELQAEAEGNFQILAKQGEGFKKLVDAAGKNPREAVLMMIADRLPQLVETQVEAIKNIEIDKVTVWENGNSENGSSTANFMKGMMGAVPPLQDLFNLAGMELPSYLKGEKGEDAELSTDVKSEG